MADEAPATSTTQLSPMAITSLSCAAGAVLFGFIGLASGSDSMFGFVGLLFLAAIITGIITLAQRRPNATPGEKSADQAAAAAGITIGTVGIVVMVVIIVLIIMAFILFMMMMTAFFEAFASSTWW